MINIIYAIIGFIICLILGVIIGIYIQKSKIVKVSDEKPVQDTKVANAMKLSNELKDYIYEKDGKLYIQVIKPKK